MPTTLRAVFFALRTLPLIVLMGLSSFQAAHSTDVATNSGEPARVEIRRTGDAWSLWVDGEPFEVHGAGMGYTDAAGVASLAEAGGNAFRTWSTEHLEVQLAAAQQHGLMVLAGLDWQKELQGFDYDDDAAVELQYKAMVASIERYRHHPALLGWIIANEPNLMVDASGAAVPPNPRVYMAMARILDYIHKHDPGHPATVTFAFTPTLADDVALALEQMPLLDFLSFQGYGALPAIAPFVREQRLDKPYMVTEFGPLGHWEMPATAWGREIEEPSGLKAQGLVQRMTQAGLDSPSGALLGSFAFLWGHKQERTPTWYGLFTEDGHSTASVDELTRLWTGRYPQQRAPSAWAVTLNGQAATDNVTLRPGESANAMLRADDPNGDALQVRWQVMAEVDVRSHGGHFEARPPVIDVSIRKQPVQQDKYRVEMQAPGKPGQYRLYAWASDGAGGVATANFPFIVQPR